MIRHHEKPIQGWQRTKIIAIHRNGHEYWKRQKGSVDEPLYHKAQRDVHWLLCSALVSFFFSLAPSAVPVFRGKTLIGCSALLCFRIMRTHGPHGRALPIITGLRGRPDGPWRSEQR